MSYPATRVGPDDKTMTIVVYVLYLLGFITAGATALVGVVMAYVLKRNASERAYSHYVFLIRTFWGALFWLTVGFVLLALGLALMIILIGFPILWLSHGVHVLTAVWFAVRCVVGLISALNDQPYGRPRAWLV